jgi:hypothetical protein
MATTKTELVEIKPIETETVEKEGIIMTGAEIKQLIISNGLRLWQVADLWGLTDGNFSRRLRKPFNDDEVKRVKAIIAQLKG